MKNKLFYLLMFLVFTNFIHAQGCSDAGFCTLQNTKEIDNFIAKSSSIAVGFGYGAGFEEIKIANSYLDYGYTVNEKLSFNSKLTYLKASGNFGSNSGLGDVFLNANYRLSTTNVYDFTFLVGTKIPLNDSNKKDNLGNSLPLDYQTSLGTLDLIAGASLLYDKKWEFSTAFQVPVSNNNKNEFVPSNFSNSTNFVPTKNFKRMPDALLRVGYLFQVPKSRLSFRPNMLAIFHLGNDSFRNFANEEIAINGSDGITINGGLVSSLTFKDNSQIELTTAAPFAVRDVRPDGLTRAFVINLQYKIRF